MINFVNFVPLFAKVIKVAIETFLFFLLILKSLSLHRDSIILYYKNDSSKWSFLEYFFHHFPLKYINNKKKKGKPLNIESKNFPEKPVQLLVESAKN